MKDYIDSYGLIIQKDKDCGDSAFLFGFYWLAQFILHLNNLVFFTTDELFNSRMFYKNMMQYCRKDERGIYWVRHPSQGWWSLRGVGGSRDNMTTILCCLVFWNQRRFAWLNIIKPLIKRCFFFWNETYEIGGKVKKIRIGDIFIPDLLSVCVRIFYSKPMYALLFLSDGLLFISTAFQTLYSYFRPDRTDIDPNLQAKLFTCYYYKRTFLVSLALIIYRFRKVIGDPWPHAFGPITALNDYFHESTNAPPLNKYWCEVWAKYFNIKL